MSVSRLLPAEFRPLLVAVLLLIGQAWLLRARYAPPAPLDEHADAKLFSARRAVSALGRVLGDQAPHPTGSPANERVRERLERELGALGLGVEDVHGMACGAYAFCAEVHDLIATIPGPEQGAWMLSAHYDSVSGGPGAADDGAGVATVLEIARALAHTPLRHPVLLVLTDGEELGGLGARLLVERYASLASVRAVINVEARGTSGPGILFETTEPNGELVSRYARAVSRPLTNSAAYTVYKALPNDTDLTVFRKQGLAGYNFAFIGSPERYHSALDDLAHLDLGSVQSSGSAALTLLRALDAHPPGQSRSNSVWFDVFGLWVTRWSEHNYSVLIAPLFLLAYATRLGKKHGSFTTAKLVMAALLLPLGLVFSLLAGLLLMAGTASAAPANWIATPVWLELCCVFATATAFALAAALLARGTTPAARLYVDALWGAALSGLCLWRAPGTSFLFLLPTLCAAWAAAAVHDVRFARYADWLRLPLVSVTALVWFPALYFVYDAIGINLPWIECAVLAVALAPLAPLMPRTTRFPYALTTAFAAVTVLCALIACRTPPFTRDCPQRLSFAYHLDADSGQARFLADASGGPVPEAVRRAGSLAPGEIDPYPWFGGWGRKALAGPAPAALGATGVGDVALEPPLASVLENTTSGGVHHVKLHISSPSGALALSLGVKARPRDVRLNGVAVVPWQQGEAWVVSQCGSTREGAEIELNAAANAPLDALVFQHAMGLPSIAAALLTARGTSGAPSQSGDVTIVSRAVRL